MGGVWLDGAVVTLRGRLAGDGEEGAALSAEFGGSAQLGLAVGATVGRAMGVGGVLQPSAQRLGTKALPSAIRNGIIIAGVGRWQRNK